MPGRNAVKPRRAADMHAGRGKMPGRKHEIRQMSPFLRRRIDHWIVGVTIHLAYT